MERTHVQPVLGIANYRARWVGRSFLVKLTASGVLPCSNYEAQLEKRVERMVPPQWNFLFFTENYCEKAIKTFEETVYFPNDVGAKSVTVFDAAGEHQIPIKEAVDVDSLGALEDGPDEFIVYAKLPRTREDHHGCITVPVGTFVTGIHYAAFGPAIEEDCKAFVAKSCTIHSLSTLRAGGEVPWPLLTEDMA